MASSKKRPTSDEVKGLLLEGNFGGNNESLPLTDPITTTQMVLKLSDIKAYDRNPRRDPNPAYDDIKESIRSKKQLNNNFNVTRRPGDDLFMVESGGNTRLQILNDLYRETGDEAFNTVHCLFVPWKSESAVLTAHLIENEMRGDMSLIDKAYATQELKRQLEDESGKVLADREFTRLAADAGYKISPKLLRRFNYAIELDQMIPQVMRSGLGGQKVDQIKQVEKAYRQYCEGKTSQFDTAFMLVMADSDDDEYWDFERVRNDLDERLSELTGVRENLLRIEVDAILFNNANGRQDVRDMDLSDQPFSDDPSVNTAHKIPQHSQPESVDQAHDDDSGDIGRFDDTEIKEQLSEIEQESEKRRRKAEAGGSGSTKANPDQHLKLLRQKNYDLACGIARLSEIDDAVMPVDDGLGFLMEIPSVSLAEITKNRNQDEPEFIRRYFIWWLLLSVAEQKVGREHHFIWQHLRSWQLLNNRSELKNPNEYTFWVGDQPHLSVLMCEFLHNKELISDQAFTNFFRLLENCRTLRSTFSDTEIWSISK